MAKFKQLPDPPASRMHFSELFDYVQTHGLYGVYTWEVDKYKAWLKEQGATRFRVVKSKGNVDPYAVICFRWPAEA